MKPDVVLDNSALIELLLARDPDEGLVRRLWTTTAAAPELVDVEAVAVVRRELLAGRISEGLAQRALRQFQQDTSITRAPHRPLVPRIWELRHNVTAYDAAYIALAEHLELPLITCDGKLAASTGHRATIELYPVDVEG